MSAVYDPALGECLLAAAREEGEPLQSGIYCACPGPAYETPAEVRMLRTLGADAVGMSTVPCAILARAAGLRVAALSCLTNHAAGHPSGAISHAGVVSVMQAALPRMRAVINRFFCGLPDGMWRAGTAV